MKKTIRNLLCCGALFATLTLSSCGGDPNAVKSVKVTGGDTTVYEYNTYDYDNLQLEFTTNNGEVSTVKVTEDMIVNKIDTTNTREPQKLVVAYNGKEYNLTVRVVESQVAKALDLKVKELMGNIEEDLKTANSVTFRLNANLNSKYFNNASPMQSMDPIEITFTKEQLADGNVLKALALLQLGFDKEDIMTSKDGRNAYANIDMMTFVNGLLEIVNQNSENLIDAVVAKILEEQDFNNFQVAFVDAFASLLKGYSITNVSKQLIGEIFTETTIAGISMYAGAYIEGTLDVEAGSTKIAELINSIITKLVAIVTMPEEVIIDDDNEIFDNGEEIIDEEIVDETEIRPITEDIKELAVEIGVALGADRKDLTDHINTLTFVPEDEEDEVAYFSAVVQILNDFGLFNQYKWVENEQTGEYEEILDEMNTTLVEQSILSLAIELDNLMNNKSAYVYSAIVDVIRANQILDNQELTDEEYEALADTKILNAVFDIAYEMDKMLNEEENNLAHAIVNAVSIIDSIAGEDFEYMSEDSQMLYNILHTYILPQVTDGNIQSIIDTLQTMENLPTEYQMLYALVGIGNFLNTNETKALINDGITMLIVNVLSENMLEGYNAESDSWQFANPYAVFDDEGHLQPYVTEIAQKIFNLIYNVDESTIQSVIDDINQIMIDNNFEDSFIDIQEKVNELNLVVKALSEGELTVEEKTSITQLVIGILHVEFAEDKDELGIVELGNFIDDVREIWLADMMQEQKIASIIAKTKELFQSENLIIDKYADAVVDLLDSLINGTMEDVVNEIANSAVVLQDLIEEQSAYLSEDTQMLLSIIGNYILPQVTAENVQSILETYSSMSNMTESEKLEVIKQGLINFVNTEKTKEFVTDEITSIIITMLSMDMEWTFDIEADTFITENPYAIYNENYELQPYITAIANKVVDAIYGDADLISTILDINDIFTRNNLYETFESSPMIINSISILIKGFTEQNLSQAEKVEFTTIIGTVLGIEFAEDEEELEEGAESKAELGLNEVSAYTDEIRRIWFNEQEPMLMKVVKILKATDGLFDSQNLVVDKQERFMISYMSGMLNDMFTAGSPNVLTNLVLSSAKLADIDYTNPQEVLEFEQEKAVLVKIAEIADNYENMTQEQLEVKLFELVCLPGYVDTLSEMMDIPPYALVMSKILVIAALDIPDEVLDSLDIDYNSLMAEFNRLLPEDSKLPAEWANLDYKEFIKFIKNMDLTDLVKIHDVRIDITQNEQGEVTKQNATFMAEFNFDMMVYRANADFTFEIELAY